MSTSTEQTPAATEWTGYSDGELAWFAEHYADTEWAVHVIGPDDVHTHADPELDDDDPANPVLTRESAFELAAGLNASWVAYKAANTPLSEYGPNVFHASVLHHGVPAESMPASAVKVGHRICSCGRWFTVDRIERGDGWTRFTAATGDGATWTDDFAGVGEATRWLELTTQTTTKAAEQHLSPAARRAKRFADLRAHYEATPGIRLDTPDGVIASLWSGGTEHERVNLLLADVNQLIRDQDKIREFWAETEVMKRVIARLVEIIDGDASEAAEELPLVAASEGAIRRHIDAQARRDEALKQARWIASEVPGDCADEGCIVVDGACLDCGTKAGAR